MELDILDQLLICMVEHPRIVPLTMRERGYTQEQISAAWTAARAARYTESTGLGSDRITVAGRARVATLRAAE